MRIAFLAPWFRTLAHVYGAGLERRGHEVVVITTPGHFQPGYGLVREQLISSRLRTLDWVAPWTRARRALAMWSPDVVLLDDTWDFRFQALASPYPYAVVVHEPNPREAGHDLSRWHSAARERARGRARSIVCFSEAVAKSLRSSFHARIFVVPLTSEMPDWWGETASAERRDFVSLGRISHYKNLDLVFDAWRGHVESHDYQGDRLVLLGTGNLDRELPPRVVWDCRRFDFAGESPNIARFKASVVMYAMASQSGVQVTSMQLGVMPISSTAGGLPEYQPALRPGIDPTSPLLLTEAFGALARPETAAYEGLQAQQHYQSTCSQSVAAERLETACAEIYALCHARGT